MRRRFSIPIRFRVGERPAGAERQAALLIDVVVFNFDIGERACRIGRRRTGDASGFCVVGSLDEKVAGALVRK